MRIKIRAFANFREILGKEIYLQLRDRATAADLLNTLASSNESFKDVAFEESGHLKDNVLLMKNKKIITSLETELDEGDDVAIFPPMAGG